MSPRHRLLVLMSKRTPSTEDLSEVERLLREEQLDWTALQETARYNSFGPRYARLKSQLSSRASVCIPRSVAAEWLVARMHCKQHTLEFRREISTLSQRMAAAGISFVVVKGLAYTHHVFHDPDVRPFGDSDLLFHHSDIIGAHEVLLQAGYRPAFPGVQTICASDIQRMSERSYHLVLYHNDRFTLEMHQTRSYPELLSAFENAQLVDGTWRVCDIVDLLIIACQHAWFHFPHSTYNMALGQTKLRHYSDIRETYLAVESQGALDGVMRRAKAIGRLEMLRTMLGLCEAVYGTFCCRRARPDRGAYKRYTWSLGACSSTFQQRVLDPATEARRVLGMLEAERRTDRTRSTILVRRPPAGTIRRFASLWPSRGARQRCGFLSTRRESGFYWHSHVEAAHMLPLPKVRLKVRLTWDRERLLAAVCIWGNGAWRHPDQLNGESTLSLFVARDSQQTATRLDIDLRLCADGVVRTPCPGRMFEAHAVRDSRVSIAMRRRRLLCTVAAPWVSLPVVPRTGERFLFDLRLYKRTPPDVQYLYLFSGDLESYFGNGSYADAVLV